jgi:gluconolactonase
MKSNLRLAILFILVVFTQTENLPAQDPVIHAPQIERIDGDFVFLEGPVWYDGSILFSDIPANKVYRWDKAGGLRIFYEPSGNSNGLMIDHNGYLILAQHGKRQIAVLDDTGEEFGLISTFKNKRFNSPNDLTLRSDGSIYFTDPPYGISKEQEELGFSGVYLWTVHDDLFLLEKGLKRPNGIALSPDESTLYVTETPSKSIYAWDVDEDKVTNKRLLAVMDGTGGGADGMKVDENGFLYVTGPGGVWIFSPAGEKIRLIEIPGQVTNCAFGGKNGDELYVTTAEALFRIWNK